MKLHKQIIQDLINPLTKNRVGRTIRTRVIPNLGVHTFIDRQVNTWVLESKYVGKTHKNTVFFEVSNFTTQICPGRPTFPPYGFDIETLLF